MDREDLIGCHALLALELSPDDRPARTWLSREEAEQLAGFVADDLRPLLPRVEDARLALAGAHFDAAELLRPGFPVFSTLDELAARVPRVQGGIVAFGAHEGRMPAQTLSPETALEGGPMRYLPWTLLAPPDLGRQLGEAMEVELIGRGEAGSRTADFLMRTLGVQLEHARYLSRHDLLAMTCVQYEHANLAPLWTLLEAALLTPYRAESTLSAHGLPLRYADGRIDADSPLDWAATPAAGANGDRTHALAATVFELRQYAAVLAAHAVPLAVGGAALFEGAALQVADDPDPRVGPVRLVAHRAPGLGVVLLDAVQAEGPQPHVLARAIPLSGRLDTLASALAERFGAASADPGAAVPLRLDDAGTVRVPTGHALH